MLNLIWMLHMRLFFASHFLILCSRLRIIFNCKCFIKITFCEWCYNFYSDKTLVYSDYSDKTLVRPSPCFERKKNCSPNNFITSAYKMINNPVRGAKLTFLEYLIYIIYMVVSFLFWKTGFLIWYFFKIW